MRREVGNIILRQTVFDKEPNCPQRISGTLENKEIIVINTQDLSFSNMDELTEFVKHCASQSDPGPHVFLLVLQPENLTEEHKQNLWRVLVNFSDRSFNHSMVLILPHRVESSFENYMENPALKDLIRKCRYRYLKQKNLDREELLTRMGQVVKENKGQNVYYELFEETTEDTTPTSTSPKQRKTKMKTFAADVGKFLTGSETSSEMQKCGLTPQQATKSVQVEILPPAVVKDDSAAVLPAHWDDMKDDLVRVFFLAPGSSEYHDVEKEFRGTGLKVNIIHIQRVQNVVLWQSYQLMKKGMEKKNKHKNNEKLLFHGTNSNAIDLINRHGFNRSYAGKYGALYGKGTHFAVDPIYAAQGYFKPDINGHKPMYLARVLVGDFTQGQPGIITPPSKDPENAADLYDSVTDNPTKPTQFIVFNDIQAYPEYLITFT
ncbi:protein mono-ADP-ribosyltransferase PARP11-like isoform X2 [Anabas testudineus]|nr:protein mono-ADP-ribosyltransferase PARP11-like isoform X2 [Anabas testudineus]XP_026198242.1 protein mono-ADP-ribosyltransferase PARP11-like isoform X2 [Anabas testudineus]